MAGIDDVSKSAVLREYGDPLVALHYAQTGARVGLWESERKLLQELVPRNARVLDLGCGAGRLTFGLHDIGYLRVEGLDISAAMIKHCRARNIAQGVDIPFHLADAAAMPLGDETFDACVFAFNGLMAIRDMESRRNVIREASRVLNEDGTLVVTSHDIRVELIWLACQRAVAVGFDGLADDARVELGDIWALEPKSKNQVPSFMHVPSTQEICSMGSEAGFDVEGPMSMTDICEESPAVMDETSDYISAAVCATLGLADLPLPTRRELGNLVYWVFKKNSRKPPAFDRR